METKHAKIVPSKVGVFFIVTECLKTLCCSKNGHVFVDMSIICVYVVQESTKGDFMDNSQSKRELIYREWERFQNGEAVDETIVAPYILRSWQRCRLLGLDPGDGARRRLAPEELESVLHRNALLIRIAQGIMERLYKPISSSDSIISISDANGIVLSCLRDEKKNYPKPDIEQGSIILESTSGSNAISICLVEKLAVETWATEHYCRQLHNWFCVAAPIWNTKNELVGVLNVTLPWNMSHNHTLGMVESAAYAISEQLRLHFLLEEQRVIFEMMDEGLVVLNGDGSIRFINKKAQQMLALSSLKHEIQHIGDVILSKDILRAILSDNASFIDQEAMLQLKNGTLSCMLSVSSARESGSRVVTLREAKRIKESAARVTGAKAVFTFNHIIGVSTALQSVIEQARRAAKSDAATLILGESGTGKELFAQSMHNASSRAAGAFITVNCGALPRELVQSELFGYDEGAFTGASRLGKPGKFELADNGTIFLDEIGEMPMDAQVSLLRLLQNGEVTRVGSKYTRQVNVRVIAATNRNLQEAIRERSFREDLYYRLNVFSLNIPPLRERLSDIRLLARHFLSHFMMTQNNPELFMTEEVYRILEGYSWPGNVRELENTVERMVFMAPDSGVIDVDSIPYSILHYRHSAHAGETRAAGMGMLEVQEKESILRGLKDCGGNIRVAAQKLGISRSGLYIKMKKFGISPDLYR